MMWPSGDDWESLLDITPRWSFLLDHFANISNESADETAHCSYIVCRFCRSPPAFAYELAAGERQKRQTIYEQCAVSSALSFDIFAKWSSRKDQRGVMSRRLSQSSPDGHIICRIGSALALLLAGRIRRHPWCPPRQRGSSRVQGAVPRYWSAFARTIQGSLLSLLSASSSDTAHIAARP